MTLDPLTAIFIAAITAITSIVGNLTSQWIVARFAQHDAKATLEAQLKATTVELQQLQVARTKEQEEAKAKNAAQQAKYDERFSEETIRSKYTFDNRSGIYHLDRTPFCPTCLRSTPPIVSPLKEEQSGWRCSSCPARHPIPTTGYFSKPVSNTG